MKREKFLWPLTSGHHEGLVICRMIQQSAKALQGDGEGDALEKLSERIMDFVKNELEPHFKAEEVIMKTFGARAGDRDMDLQRFLTDHRRLRYLLREGSLDSLTAFSVELDDHIRFEENQLFPRLEKTLTDDEKKTATSVLEETIPSHSISKQEKTPKEA